MRRRARGFDRFSLKTEGDGFDRFGLKNGVGLGAAKVRAEVTWRHREACVEVKRSREGDVSIQCSYKKLDDFAPAWAVIVVNSVWVFLVFRQDYI